MDPKKPPYIADPLLLLKWGEGGIEESSIKHDIECPGLGGRTNNFKRTRDVENALKKKSFISGVYY